MSNNNLMGVLLNGIAQLEYDRNKPLPDHQAAYLQKMDRKMDEEGIDLGGEHVVAPEPQQRAQFVAANLATAITHNNEAVAAAMCSYLAVRLPELRQVKIEEQGDECSINLVFDEEYRKQVSIPLSQIN